MGEYTVTGSGAACKAVVLDSEGSSPSSPTTMPTSTEVLLQELGQQTCSQWVGLVGRLIHLAK